MTPQDSLIAYAKEALSKKGFVAETATSENQWASGNVQITIRPHQSGNSTIPPQVISLSLAVASEPQGTTFLDTEQEVDKAIASFLRISKELSHPLN